MRSAFVLLLEAEDAGGEAGDCMEANGARRDGRVVEVLVGSGGLDGSRQEKTLGGHGGFLHRERVERERNFREFRERGGEVPRTH